MAGAEEDDIEPPKGKERKACVPEGVRELELNSSPRSTVRTANYTSKAY